MLKFKKLLRLLIHTRRLGYTTLLQNGTENYDRNFFILGHNEKYAHEIKSKSNNKFAKSVSIDNPDIERKIFGYGAPFAIDNAVLLAVLEEADSEYEKAHEKITELLRRNVDLDNSLKTAEHGILLARFQSRNLIRKFEDMSLFNRIFNYKKIIKKEIEKIKYY